MKKAHPTGARLAKKPFGDRLGLEWWTEERQVLSSIWMCPVRMRKKQGWVTGN